MGHQFQPPFIYIFFIMLNLGVFISTNFFFWQNSAISLWPFLIISIFEILLSLVLWRHGKVASKVKYEVAFSTLILVILFVIWLTRSSCGTNCFVSIFLLLVFIVFRITYIIQLHLLGKLAEKNFLQAQVTVQKLDDETKREPLFIRQIPEPVLAPQPMPDTRTGAIGFESMAALEAESTNKTQRDYGWAV